MQYFTIYPSPALPFCACPDHSRFIGLNLRSHKAAKATEVTQKCKNKQQNR